ncbi:MAG: iron-sulfur cluster-binding protein [Anaerolineae bacterium]|nr:iron-sulfur cluster-binding protein [Anaerolineae bacterium]
MLSFSERIEAAQANPERIAAIQRAAMRFYNHRQEGITSLPDADAARDLARKIRAHTIAHLDEYLLQLEAAAQANGTQVHWARDAAAAQNTIRAIAAQNNVRLAVKSKSMVSEEVGVNHALQADGVQVVETDLGEYIAQLSGDTPSHIIAPVLHLTRQEVGYIFQDNLGVSYTDDPLKLNDIARQTLRQLFLRADMGISGCNFAVAETGTTCIVTNEGNGRMVTTLPRIHVVLMGMERLVPTPDDLAVMLQLLARSATGQKMSVYTSLTSGPRRPDEPHGPEQVHLIILDNGRSQALAGEMAEILYCIRCGACLNACPVYRVIGGHAYGSVYSGPVGAVVSPILGGMAAHGDLPHASTLCGACQEVCPVRIDLPKLLLRLRRQGVEAGQTPLWLRMGMNGFAAAAARPTLFALAQKVAGLLLGGTWKTTLPAPAAGWTQFRHFPPFDRQRFQDRER